MLTSYNGISCANNIARGREQGVLVTSSCTVPLMGSCYPGQKSEADRVRQQLSSGGSEAQGRACPALLYLEMPQSLLCSSQVLACEVQHVLQVRLVCHTA